MKKWITILLALALVLSMTACGTPESPTYTEEKPEPLATETTNPIEVPTISANDPDAQIETLVETTLATLTSAYEALAADVDSYDTYIQKQDEIAAFYETAVAASEDLCSKMYVYALAYTENILTSDASTDDMYDEMDIVYDLIYDDMGDEIYDGIYDGVLDDLYDDFYDGVLDDQPDGVEYSDWADARSDEYEQWSDSRSDTYDHWSDFRSDVYDLWADVRSELWDDNLEGALEELDDFRADVEKMKGKEVSAPAETTATEDTKEDTETDSIRPEFKEAMDSYEKFFDEYVTFMKAYMDSDDPLGMMGEYTTMMQQYVETMGELEDIDEDELSDEEALYYAEVVLRINQKLLEVI